MLKPVLLLLLAAIFGDADEPLTLTDELPHHVTPSLQKENERWIHLDKESSTENDGSFFIHFQPSKIDKVKNKRLSCRTARLLLTEQRLEINFYFWPA